jgi:hypothetical protein
MTKIKSTTIADVFSSVINQFVDNDKFIAGMLNTMAYTYYYFYYYYPKGRGQPME